MATRVTLRRGMRHARIAAASRHRARGTHARAAFARTRISGGVAQHAQAAQAAWRHVASGMTR